MSNAIGFVFSTKENNKMLFYVNDDFIYAFNSIFISKIKMFYLLAVVANGFLNTKITESPRKNIFEMNLSLLTGLTFFFPFPVLGTSVHISFTLF